jgi:4-amino-4-deoxy-L-arabinose transferase-like glycosyltransferase
MPRPDRDEDREIIVNVTPSGTGRLDFLASGQRPWLLLVLLCLSLYLPGLTNLPPVDRDEARFIQATRQMLETQDFVQIRFQDEARNKKPVGIYWLQSAAVAVLSSPASAAVWPYRLVSLGGAMAAVLMLFGFGTRIFDRRTALIGAGFLASAVDLIFEAHIATTDAVLLASAVAAQGSLAAAYLSARRGEAFERRLALLFWVAEAVAILVKGPVVPAITLLTGLALVAVERRPGWLKRLGWWWGVPLLLLLVAPWFVLVERATDGAFLKDALGHDFLGKVAGGQEAHGAPPGYYLVAALATFWPVTLFVGLAAVWAWRHRRLAATRLLLAWALPFWIVLELVPTKLPHYVLPLYPALALLAARALIAHVEEGFQPRSRLWVIVPAVLWSLVGAALGAGLIALPLWLGWSFQSSVGGAVAAAGILAGLWQFWRVQRGQHGIGSALLAVVLAAFVAIPGFGIVLPSLDPLWLSRSAATLVAAEARPGDRLAAIGYAEPSLVFLTGTDTELLAPGADLSRDKADLILVTQKAEAQFRAGLAARHMTASARGAVSGYDYSNGHWMTLVLYRLRSSS